MLFREQGTVSDSDGATGAHRLVGGRPVEHGCDRLRQRKRKIQPLNRSQGFPFGGEGVTLAISMPDKKNSKGFLRAKIALYLKRFSTKFVL